MLDVSNYTMASMYITQLATHMNTLMSWVNVELADKHGHNEQYTAVHQIHIV